MQKVFFSEQRHKQNMFQKRKPFGRLHRPHANSGSKWKGPKLEGPNFKQLKALESKEKASKYKTLRPSRNRLYTPKWAQESQITVLDPDAPQDPWVQEEIEEVKWKRPKFPFTTGSVSRPVSPGKRAAWTKEQRFWSKRGNRFIPLQGSFPKKNWKKRPSRVEREADYKRSKRKRLREMIDEAEERVAVRNAGQEWPDDELAEDRHTSRDINFSAVFWHPDSGLDAKTYVEIGLDTQAARIYAALRRVQLNISEVFMPYWLSTTQRRWNTAKQLAKYGLKIKVNRPFTRVDYNLWIIPFLKEKYGEYWVVEQQYRRIPFIMQTDRFGNVYDDKTAKHIVNRWEDEQSSGYEDDSEE